MAEFMDLVTDLKAKGETFAIATVVRTVAATAAKAGAKALIRTDGTITGGWIGGGCARGAVMKAAKEAMADGQPRLISVQPPEALAAQGLTPGDARDGVRFARSMCPSKGTMDIFIEAVVPRPELVVFGSSPVAVALAALARTLGYATVACAPAADHGGLSADRLVDGFAIAAESDAQRFIVVATQGKGDVDALTAALGADAGYCAFVGSRAKAAALREKLAATISADRLAALKAPAGLDFGAITPEEIALSILAEITQVRRRGVRA